MGGFPSGQRGQTVNLLQLASVVRIHLRPVNSERSFGYAQIAQLVEQRTENPRVAGSIPALGIEVLLKGAAFGESSLVDILDFSYIFAGVVQW